MQKYCKDNFCYCKVANTESCVIHSHLSSYCTRNTCWRKVVVDSSCAYHCSMSRYCIVYSESMVKILCDSLSVPLTALVGCYLGKLSSTEMFQFYYSEVDIDGVIYFIDNEFVLKGNQNHHKEILSNMIIRLMDDDKHKFLAKIVYRTIQEMNYS
jgi:hypothetical protein